MQHPFFVCIILPNCQLKVSSDEFVRCLSSLFVTELDLGSYLNLLRATRLGADLKSADMQNLSCGILPRIAQGNAPPGPYYFQIMSEP